jgi:hypothetical protein
MISLHISGSLRQARTFPNELPRRLVGQSFKNNSYHLAKENLKLARRFNADKRIIKAMAAHVNEVSTEDFCADKSFLGIQGLLLREYLIRKPIRRLREASARLARRSGVFARLVDSLRRRLNSS